MIMNFYDMLLAEKLSGSGGASVIESLSVTENGEYVAPSGVDGYSPVTVNVPSPTGTISITQNGTVDVAQYASANVNVSGGSSDDSFAKLVDGSIVTANIPSGVTKIKASAFYQCANLESVTIPSGVTSIASGAFRECPNITSISLPNSVTDIGTNAFYQCTNLANVNIPTGLTSLSDGCFWQTDITSIIVPSGVTSIGTSFASCRSLTSALLPDTLTTLRGTFNTCSALNSIVIPSSVTEIGGNTFKSCTSLVSLTCEAVNPPTVTTSTFQSAKADMAIYVPAESVDTYKSASGWSARASYIQAIPE
jgi:hypothetical protein